MWKVLRNTTESGQVGFCRITTVSSHILVLAKCRNIEKCSFKRHTLIPSSSCWLQSKSVMVFYFEKQITTMRMTKKRNLHQRQPTFKNVTMCRYQTYPKQGRVGLKCFPACIWQAAGYFLDFHQFDDWHRDYHFEILHPRASGNLHRLSN